MEASPSAAAPAVAATADHDEGEKQSTESAAATINATAADGSKTDGPDGDEPEEPAAWRWRQAQGRQFKGLTEEDGEAEWRGPFLFAVLADTQLGAMDDNEGWEDEVALCQEAVRRLNKLKPRFAIVCGDLVHHTPELYPDTDPGIRKRQVLDFKRAFAGLHESIPLLCVCGNHDIGNTPTKETIDRFADEFGNDFYAFWCGNVRGLVVNTNLLFDPSKAQEAYDAQQAWLAQEMAAAKAKGAKHILLFGHHPLFLQADDEGEDDAVLGHSTFTTHKGQQVSIANSYFHIPTERRRPILELMQAHGASHFFSGHWHQNGLAASERYGVQNVITSAVGLQIGQDQSGFRLVRVFKDAIDHRYFSFEKMPDGPVSLDPADKGVWAEGRKRKAVEECDG